MIVTRDTPTIRSFCLVFYDDRLQQVGVFEVPVGVTAPFGNRLFAEGLTHLDGSTPIHEPWYTLTPSKDRGFQRSELPIGPTSLYGRRYDPADESGPPLSHYPDATIRCFVVRLLDMQHELFQGVYSVDDVFLHIARYLLENGVMKRRPSEGRGRYYYEVLPSSDVVPTVAADVLPADAYDVEGVFRLPPRSENKPRIQFRPIPQPSLADRDPATFPATQVLGKGEPQSGRVFIPEGIYAKLSHELSLSDQVEEGGFLLGNVYRQLGSDEKEDAPDFRWLVEITDLVMAEKTVGSAARLLFTGDSWSQVSRRRDRDHPGRKLVGWFHTHVFPATDDFGLSGLDQDMHAWFLPKPWHVAILLNLEKNGNRTVRCYQRGPDRDLVESPFEIFDESPGLREDEGNR